MGVWTPSRSNQEQQWQKIQEYLIDKEDDEDDLEESFHKYQKRTRPRSKLKARSKPKPELMNIQEVAESLWEDKIQTRVCRPDEEGPPT